jgi:transposase
MTILIDEAVWPAHGTVWGHLVSDESLDELHAFAAAAGMPKRAFDNDHYDYPASRRDELIAQGATPVTGRELVRRLKEAGLRVRQVDKH